MTQVEIQAIQDSVRQDTLVGQSSDDRPPSVVRANPHGRTRRAMSIAVFRL